MVKNKSSGKGTEPITDPRRRFLPESSKSKADDPRCPPSYEPYQQLPSGFPLIQQVPSQSPGYEHIKLVWQKETHETLCESSIPFSAEDISLQNFCSTFAHKARLESEDGSNGLQADSCTQNPELYNPDLPEPIRTSSDQPVKNRRDRVRNSSNKQPEKQRKRRNATSKRPSGIATPEQSWPQQCSNLLDPNDDLDDAELVEYQDGGRPVCISDIDEFTNFYDIMFRQIGQLSLKKILKCWIRKVHPKKQATYPYNGGVLKEISMEMYGKDNPGEKTKPPWWPPSLTSNQWERSRHKEPDHQRKTERQVLAVWVLRYFLVEGLKESTMDIAPLLEPKFREMVPPLLEEVYKIRKEEEKLTRSDFYVDKNAFIILPNPILIGSKKTTNHPPPTNREPMELPFITDTPSSSRSHTPEFVPQDPESIEQQLNNATMHFDLHENLAIHQVHVTGEEQYTSPIGNSLQDGAQTIHPLEQFHHQSREQFSRDISPSFAASSYGDPIEPAIRSVKHKREQILSPNSIWTNQGSMYYPPDALSDTILCSTLESPRGMPERSQLSWGDDATSGTFGGPQYQTSAFSPNPPNFNMDEDPYGQSGQFFAQQTYNAINYGQNRNTLG